jgi:hypothetical protein
LASSPFFAAITLIHQTSAHMTGQLRATQDLRQRFLDCCFTAREGHRVIAKVQVGVLFAEGVGLEPTSPFGQRFSSYEHTILTLPK